MLIVGLSPNAAHGWKAAVGDPERVLVPTPSGRGLSASILDRARAFLISELGAQCRCPFIDWHEQPQDQPLDQTAASALALRFDADVVVALDLDHAGAQTRFTLAVFRMAPGRATVGTPQVLAESTTLGPERIGPVLHTLVTRLYQTFPDPPPQTSIQAIPRLYYVTGAIGVLGQLNTAGLTDRLMPAFALSLARYAETSIAEMRLDFAAQDIARRTALGLSYSFRLGPRWSVGMTASWVWQHLGGRGTNGAALQPMLGYLVPLGRDLSFRFEGGYVLNLFQEKQMDRLIPGSDARHWSHGPQLLVGVVL